MIDNLNKYVFLILLTISMIMAQNIRYYEKNSENFADVTVNELTFNCRVSGLDNSGETIILLHGFPETSRMWYNLMKVLSDSNYRVIAPDQRGYSPGAKPLEIEDYTIDLLSQDIIDIADAFSVEKFHLVGHDWGSAVGWALASNKKERVLTWTALSVPHLDAFSDAMENDEVQAKKSGYISFFRMRFLPEFYFKVFNYKNLKRIWTQSSDDEINHYMDIFSQKNTLKTSLHWYRANFPSNSRRVGDIHVPTLIIYGKNDMAVGETAVDESEKYLKADYEIKKVDAGHWLIQESFDEVSEYILDYIRK